MGTKWRYPLDNDLKQQEILAEIVSHAITRIELLEEGDSACLVAEYKEWLADDIDNDVISLRKLRYNF